MSKFILSIMSRDRVGIVADVAGAIKALQGNLEDMTQTVLRGYFTMILLAEFPDDLDQAAVRDGLARNSALAGLAIDLAPFTDSAAAQPQATPSDDSLYVLTSSGPDRPGIVSTIAELLRAKDINIVDLNTTVHQGAYNVMLLVSIPAGTDVAKLKRSIQVTMGDLGLKAELRHQALFRKTNDI